MTFLIIVAAILALLTILFFIGKVKTNNRLKEEAENLLKVQKKLEEETIAKCKEDLESLTVTVQGLFDLANECEKLGFTEGKIIKDSLDSNVVEIKNLKTVGDYNEANHKLIQLINTNKKHLTSINFKKKIIADTQKYIQDTNVASINEKYKNFVDDTDKLLLLTDKEKESYKIDLGLYGRCVNNIMKKINEIQKNLIEQRYQSLNVTDNYVKNHLKMILEHQKSLKDIIEINADRTYQANNYVSILKERSSQLLSYCDHKSVIINNLGPWSKNGILSLNNRIVKTQSEHNSLEERYNLFKIYSEEMESFSGPEKAVLKEEKRIRDLNSQFIKEAVVIDEQRNEDRFIGDSEIISHQAESKKMEAYSNIAEIGLPGLYNQNRHKQA